MRYSRMESRQPPEKPKSNKGALIFVILVALAVGIYVISASEAGKFLAEKIVDPVVAVFSGDEELSETTDTDGNNAAEEEEISDEKAETISFEVEEFSMYALQAGVFSDEENAQKYAEELRNKGGAGFVTTFENGYRVFISGYTSEEDAQNVKARLLSEQNMDTSVFEMLGESIAAEVKAEEDIAELIKGLDINGDIVKLTEISISKDKGDITEEEALEQLTTLYNNASMSHNAFNQIENDELATALAEYYSSLCDTLTEAMSESGEVAFSSRIKLAYLSAADARGRLGEEISAE